MFTFAIYTKLSLKQLYNIFSSNGRSRLKVCCQTKINATIIYYRLVIGKLVYSIYEGRLEIVLFFIVPVNIFFRHHGTEPSFPGYLPLLWKLKVSCSRTLYIRRYGGVRTLDLSLRSPKLYH